MPNHVICLKYKIKDLIKGWVYNGVFPLGESGPENNDTEDELKRKMASIILKRNLIFTHTLFLILKLGPLRSVGLNPYNKSLLKTTTNTVKIDLADHLGLSHYVVAGSQFTLEGIEIGIYDKDDYTTLKFDM